MTNLLAAMNGTTETCALRFVCRTCNAEKNADEFPNDKRKKHGKSSQCKVCLYAYVKAWSARKDRKELRRAWQKSEAGKNAGKARHERRKQELTDSYVAKVLALKGGLGNNAATPEILEMKRQQLAIKKLSKQLKKATHESSKDIDRIPGQHERGNDTGRLTPDRGKQPASPGPQGN